MYIISWLLIGILLADKKETPCTLFQTKSYRNHFGLEFIRSFPNFVLQNIRTGVCLFLRSRLTCFQKASKSILMSQAHPSDCMIVSVCFPSFKGVVRHPYGKSQMKQSIEFADISFITSRQSPWSSVRVVIYSKFRNPTESLLTKVALRSMAH